MDLLVPIVVALLGGGLLGSIVTSYVTTRTSRQAREDLAAEALWAYQAAVRGFSDSLFQSAGYGEEMAIPGKATLKDVAAAQAAAVKYSGFLPAEARSLVRQPQFDFLEAYGDDLAGAESSRKVADQLETQLDHAFSRVARRPRRRLTGRLRQIE